MTPTLIALAARRSACSIACMSKKCSRCKAIKPVGEFHRNRAQPDGRSHYCKPCASIRKREDFDKDPDRVRRLRNAGVQRWKERHPERHRAKNKQYSDNVRRFKRYGITRERYEEMLLSQGGCCAICSEELDGLKLDIDHCHETGVVRGLLCNKCNRGVGFFKDDPSRLRAAADYLERSACFPS